MLARSTMRAAPEPVSMFGVSLDEKRGLQRCSISNRAEKVNIVKK